MDKKFWIDHSNNQFEVAKGLFEELNYHFPFWMENRRYVDIEKLTRRLITRLTSTLFFLKELERMDE